MSGLPASGAVPPRASGSVETYVWSDGRTVTLRARVRAYGRRHWVDFGTNVQGWSVERAEIELERIRGQIERGTWEPPVREKVTASEEPVAGETFHVFASRWWEEKQATLGENARADYWWRLQHLLGELHRVPISDFTKKTVDGYRKTKVAERAALEEAHRVAREKDRRAPARRPLSNRSINMHLDLLAQILDLAVEYGLLDANPARGKKRRLPTQQSRRNFLEPDMVIDLLNVAGEWEAKVPPHQRYGRRPFLATLILAGPRISELIEAERGRLDVHAGALELGKKTAAGIERHLDLTAFLLGELRAHLASVPARVGEHRPDMPVFPSQRGGPLSASNIRNRLLAETVARTNERRAGQGKMLLPARVTPHTLRRTFASLCFFAGRDLRYVMGQLGHDDPRMTLAVYAQAMRRRNVDDALVWELMRFADEPESRARGPKSGPTASGTTHGGHFAGSSGRTPSG